MVDRTIILAENSRASYRGIYQIGPRDFLAYQSADDDLSYVIDLANLLGSATVSSVTRTTDGPTVSGTSNTTTTVTQRLKGQGVVTIKTTDSASNVHAVRVEIRERANEQRPDDYA